MVAMAKRDFSDAWPVDEIGNQQEYESRRNDLTEASFHSYLDDEDLCTGAGEGEEYDEEEAADENTVDNAIRQYLSEIGRYPLLTAEQEMKIAQRVAEGIRKPSGNW